MLQSASSSTRGRCCHLATSVHKAHSLTQSSAAALARAPPEAPGKWARPPPLQNHNLATLPQLLPRNPSAPGKWALPPSVPGVPKSPPRTPSAVSVGGNGNSANKIGSSPSSPAGPSRSTHQPELRTTPQPSNVNLDRWRKPEAAPKPINTSSFIPSNSFSPAFTPEWGSTGSRSYPMDKRKANKGGSVLDRMSRTGAASATSCHSSSKKLKEKSKSVHAVKAVQKDIYVPKAISVGNLTRLLKVKRDQLADKMHECGLGDASYDRILQSDDACLLVMEFGRNPIVDEEASFDLYPDPTPSDPTSLPLRPPVVTIMGHVDHGKTTLLDTLRSASVAASESGGITQHIGAFSVPLKSLSVKTSTSTEGPRTITFLDTPGHAAFSAMRARGAGVTDIIVLVVAADDGVMPQTKEVIELSRKESSVQLVVAINKCDKPGVDVSKIKHSLLSEGVQLEEFGGDIPCVEVSGLTGLGLDNLMETISAVAEVSDLRAEVDTRAHGVVLEAKMDKGRGATATVLVLRGSLKRGDYLAAGTTWAKVRQMTDDKGAHVNVAHPGTPVTVAGWKELPVAGDEAICGSAKNGADEVKRAIQNRIRERDAAALLEDIQSINEKRKTEREHRDEFRAIGDKKAEQDSVYVTKDDGIKELRLIIKTDVSGTTEAVVGALSGIGNKIARVNIIQSSVGDIIESDIVMAKATDATILGFNVKSSGAMDVLAGKSGVPIHIDTVIYRIIDEVRSRVAALLPPIVEKRVIGEAVFQELFEIKLRGRDTLPVAGCRVTNGTLSRHHPIRVVRNGEVVYEGLLDTLKHLKKDVMEIRKGMECGLNIGNYKAYQVGDVIQTFKVIETPGIL